MAKPRILILYTGGTIGMTENPVTHALEPFDFDHLIENVPKIRKLDYEIDNLQLEPPIDSSDISPRHWQEMAASIAAHYEAYDGFVVLHGTDTMAYTASALSFMLRNLAKPVIITGSQLPIGEVRTDGEENLITALQIAATADTDGRPLVREVAILFEDFLWRGNRATKMSADNFNAFRSNNYPALARIGLGISFRREALLRRDNPALPLLLSSGLDASVSILDLYPGLSESTLRHVLATPGMRGLILKTYGAGNGPTAPWFVGTIAEAVAKGLVIVNISQCPDGGVNPMRYATGRALADAGVISGHDMTMEAALTKMMHLFGLGVGLEEVKRCLVTDYCGELTL